MNPLQQAIALLQVARDLIETDARFRDPAELRNKDRLEDAADAIGVALSTIESVCQPTVDEQLTDYKSVERTLRDTARIASERDDDDYERAAEDAERIANAREDWQP